MANFDEIDTNCLCQYTLTIRDKTIDSNSASMKDNFNSAPSMHEIDEEDDDDDEDYAEVCSKDTSVENSKEVEEYAEDAHEDQNNAEPDDESTYSADSFCSDISYQDTEGISRISRTTTRSVRSRSPSLANLDHVENGTVDVLDVKDEEDPESAELQNIDYESYINGSLENLASCEKLGNTRCKRRNMSFSDDEMRKIERENELLLRKIMAQHKSRNKANKEVSQHPRASSSAINRKKMQRKIEGDNMLLLRRIQQAKPRVTTNTGTTGYRLTLF